MSLFSAESLLVAKNWEIIEDIIKAKEQLRNDLTKFLLSLEADLSSQDWWATGWEFVHYQDSQIYISHEKWSSEGDYAYYAVWIGVEGLIPERIFGLEPAPNLYVWTANKRYNLAQELVNHLVQEGAEIIGELDKRATGYVVKEPLKKCLPEEVEGYLDLIRQRIIEFLTYYAQLLPKFDHVIQKHVQSSSQV